MDQPRLAAGLGLLAQVADVNVESLRVGSEVVVPDAFEDLLSGQDPPRVLEEELEQQVLGTGQLQHTVAALDRVADRVELEIGEDERLLVVWLVGAPQERP